MISTDIVLTGQTASLEYQELIHGHDKQKSNNEKQEKKTRQKITRKEWKRAGRIENAERKDNERRKD